MKKAVTALLFLTVGCGSGDQAAGGGDDFPSMTALAGEQAARILNGELNAENPPSIAPAGMVRSGSSRAYSISGDTLFIDTAGVSGTVPVQDRYAVLLADPRKIFRADRTVYDSAGTYLLKMRDYDGDGWLWTPELDSHKVRIDMSGSRTGVWWYSGDSLSSMTLRRWQIETAGKKIFWFRPGGDSLETAGAPVRLISVSAEERAEADLIPQGSADNLADDRITAVRLTAKKRDITVHVEAVPEVPSLYRSILDRGTLKITCERGDSVLTLEGTYSEQGISAVTSTGEKVEFNRAGKEL